MIKNESFKKGKLARKKDPVKINTGKVKNRDLVSLIRKSEHGKDAEILKLKHEKMKESLYNYLRGTAQIQAFDLAAEDSTDVIVQCAGDAHIQNFEGYLYTHESLCFDITDFDETYTAPFEWDLKRFAVSIAAAGRDNDISDNACKDIILNSISEYRKWIMENYDSSFMNNWYKAVVMGINDKIKPLKLFKFEENVIHGMIEDIGNGEFRIKESENKICHIEDVHEKKKLQNFIEEYGRSLSADGRHVFHKMKLMDLVKTTSGVGSMGLKKYMALFKVYEDHFIVLEIKEERISALEAARKKKETVNNGERIFSAQRILRTTYDLFAGWGTMPGGKHFYVRRLLNTKLSLDVKDLSKKSLGVFADECGKVLALYHLKTIDPAFLAGYINKTKSLEKDLAKYAVTYCDQLEKDHKIFCKNF